MVTGKLPIRSQIRPSWTPKMESEGGLFFSEATREHRTFD